MDSESPAVRQAFLRDSVKWLISKAFNNDVPDDIKEPFYKDHENQERLKPQIVVQLGNATLFCQTLSNLYSDPNCHNLNHWSILQILTRKGVLVAEASDIPITETVLIQTNPLIIKAHMSVIESLMNLYAREILCGDLVSNAIKRISGSSLQEQIGPDCEQSLFAWVSQVYVALKRRIAKEADASTSDQYCVKIVMPDFPPLQDFLDVCDGMWLAVLISYYCPKILPWTQVRIKCYPTLEDSAHNASLVSIFSQEHLPNSVFQINELIQMRRSMKSHLIVFLADLFDFFEIHPQKCVSYRGILTDFDEPDTHFFASNTPGRVQLGYDTDSGSEKQDHETEKYLLGQQIRYLCPGKHQSSFEKDYDDRSVSHYLGSHNCSHNNFGPINEESKSLLDVSKLATIRMKLEEKHRRIEQNKNNIEVVITRHEDKSTNPELMQGISTQFYGSQQHLAVHCQKNLSRRQPNFGSTPHLTQAFSSPNKEFISPSRDLHQQRVQPQPIQYINEHRQHIINQPMQQSPLMLSPTHFTLKPYNICKVNGAQVSCSRLIYGGGSHHYQLESPSHYQYNLQLPQQEFGNRFTEHDIFPSGKSHQPNEISINESTLQPLRRTWLNSLQHQNHPSSATIPITCQLTNFFPEAESPNACIKQPENSVFHQNGECNDYEQNKISEDIFQVHITPHYTKQQQQLSTNLKEHYSAAKNKPQVIETQAPIEDMAPQSICFIGDEDDVDEIERNIIESMKSTRLCGRNEYGIIRQQLPQDHNPCYFLENYESDFKPGKLNITSGSLTYRVPSPSRPLLNKSSFQDENKERLIDKKGFYISFDDDIPTRPKPPLRTKRLPRKKSFEDNANHKLNRESVSTPKRNLYENDCTKKERIDNENFEISKATYNKYTDPPIRFKFSGDYKDFSRKNYAPKCSDQRHLEGIVNDQASQSLTEHINLFPENRIYNELKGNVLVIGRDVSNLDPNSVDEMERRKEKIVLLSLQRRQQQEEAKARKEIEANERREREREKEEVRSRKKEEQIARRAVILEKHRLKKAIEEAEHEGKTHDRSEISINQQFQTVNSPRLRQQRVTRLRPKTIHIDTGSVEVSKTLSMCSHGKKGSSTNSTEPAVERGRTLSRITSSRHSVAKGTTVNFRGRKSNSLMNLCDTDSGLGSATPPRRAHSPGMLLTGRHMPTLSGPGSLPSGSISKRRGFDDSSSDALPISNSTVEYSGLKLYKQPEAKSNRGIILNAVEYCVFPGVVNRNAKQKVLEKIARSEAKHFLILFRDSGCQFRALYSYTPEREHVLKLYGTGPSQVEEIMFDKFFKYNSGGKCFSQVHTKHLTVTIDAFTIHNSLWQGKKVHLPSKKDMALII